MSRKSLIGAAAVMVCGLMLGCGGDESSDGKSGGGVSEERRSKIAAELRKENLSSKDYALAMVAATGTPKEIAAEIAKGVDRPNDLLFLAARYNENPEIITALINAGANENVKDKNGNTPLHSAAKYNKNPEIITALIKAGAGVNANTYKRRYAATFCLEG
ncbi:hypothetical protein FACS1894139_16950 [Planctomycetales bacterium]|nr:hypothetical protein FACS1894107_16770 [Planctomycetales bacterium]GHS99706.1 hypothetical protein FACS1894108_10210 [Planctomycetales bacterium]GHT07920.1 hypothetical protein FACS1894139_16950 [Planctomycetales bacterium]